MNRKERKYKIAVLALSAAVILEGIFLLYFWAGRPKKPVKLPIKPKAKIAIVIDDFGYSLNNLHIFDEIKYPLTAAVLPNLNYSRYISEELHNRGFEVILHLPMEPREEDKLEKNTVLTSLSEDSIRNILSKDLDSLKYAKGVSNHMGSRATEDRRVMGIILGELKKRRLYFLDSFVSSKSICAELAKKSSVGFARRDVFLDNRQDSAYIRKQIKELKAKAQSNGSAIGIGHDRKATLLVLKEVLPELEKEGYKLVFVSELVK